MTEKTPETLRGPQELHQRRAAANPDESARLRLTSTLLPCRQPWRKGSLTATSRRHRLARAAAGPPHSEAMNRPTLRRLSALTLLLMQGACVSYTIQHGARTIACGEPGTRPGTAFTRELPSAHPADCHRHGLACRHPARRGPPDSPSSLFATGLQHPRWLYTLPNGDVLVAETNAPDRPADGKGIKGWGHEEGHDKSRCGRPFGQSHHPAARCRWRWRRRAHEPVHTGIEFTLWHCTGGQHALCGQHR